MNSLWIANFQSEGVRLSEEFRFLLDWITVEAKTVFDNVVIGEYSQVPPTEFEFVLILGKDPIYLSAASLMAMKSALDPESDAVIPISIATIPTALDTPMYTFSDFARLEQQILAQWNSISKPSHHDFRPVSLWRRNALIENWPNSEQTQGHIEALDTIASSMASAGVYYAFEDYFGHTRTDILPFIPLDTNTILEVGCGKGLTGELLQARCNCLVTGIELNPKIADVAAGRLHKVITHNVEHLIQSNALNQRFDTVLALDVIEHLQDPVAFFRWTRERLNEAGRLVAIIPNIGHYSVVRDLVAGRWDYTPTGIQCITHLRFFTRSGIERMLRMAGYSEWTITAKTTALPSHIEHWGEVADVDLESLSTESFYLVAERPANDTSSHNRI